MTKRWPMMLAAVPMITLLVLPVLALVLSTTPSDLAAAVQDDLFLPAISLSLQTSLVSLVLVLLLGTPLSLWLAVSPPSHQRWMEGLVDLPIVLPPAVVGIGLLQAFGRSGVLGAPLDVIGIQISFTTLAVVLAQVVVASPFYIRSAAEAFRRVDVDRQVVARTLGHSPISVFARVTVPLALPGVIAGAALAWARALGEFGATLLFAGSLVGVTQTMPLAIYDALQSDVRVAVALALVLAAISVLLLIGLRAALGWWGEKR